MKQLLSILLLFISLLAWSNNYDKNSNTRFENRIAIHIKEIDSLKSMEPINWEEVNKTQLTLSSLYRNTGEYTKAMVAALEGVRIAETYRNGEGLLASYQDVANSLRYKANYTEAHEYMRKAINGTLKFKDEKKKEKYLAYFYYQHTLIFQEEGKYLDSALYFHKISLELKEKLGNEMDIPKSHMSIGYIHYKLGNNQTALESLLLADSLFNSIKSKTAPNAWLRKKLKINNYLGLVYYSMGDISKAIKNFRESAKGSELINIKNIALSSYKNLADCYKKQNRLDSALFYFNKYITINNEVFNKKSNQQIEELKTVYETEKKDVTIKKQNLEIAYNNAKINKFIAIVASLLLLIIALIILSRNKRLKAESKLQSKFSQDLISNIEDERKRISRDLHDSIGQNLILIKNQNSLLKLKLVDKELIEKSNKINIFASQTIEELREISNNLTPYQLDILGLTKAIENLIDNVESTSQITCIKNISNIDSIVEKNLQINLIRIVQELLNNIIKHSKATKIYFFVTTSKIIISDNGVGYNTSNKSNGMGVSNFTERAKLLKAESKIESSPNLGTKITLEFTSNN